MSGLHIEQIPVLDDNYVYLAHCPETDQTAVVDPAVAMPVMERLERKGWTLDYILNTHHHGDHTGANLELKKEYKCKIVGAEHDARRIPGIDIRVKEGDTVALGAQTAKVFDVAGHTNGHIAYWFADSHALFCGDTLFALGCGRLFEGTPARMWQSLLSLRGLPDDTKVYCAHEYTEANARFALSVDPGNAALVRRFEVIKAVRGRGKPTVPSLLGEEKATNPFLRADQDDMQQAINMRGQNPVDVFAEIRSRKDNF